jgi:hypothetical protein
MSEIYFEDYLWYVKISDKYNNIKYVEVSINQNISSIDEIFDIMKDFLPDGYYICDYDNLYTLNDIPCEYWSQSKNPICFDIISESISGESEIIWDIQRDLNTTYFDTFIETF